MTAAVDLRASVVAEALSWRGTPWHHMAQLKGVGVDCAQFLIGVYSAAGLVPPIAPGYYPPDWHLHREEPRFLAILLEHAQPVPVAAAMPGDVVMFKFGRHAAHGGIVVEWPRIVHAWLDERMVVETDVRRTPRLQERLAGFYCVRGLE